MLDGVEIYSRTNVYAPSFRHRPPFERLNILRSDANPAYICAIWQNIGRELVPNFFKHPVFQTQFRHLLLELLVLFAKLADFITVGLAHRIAFQALFSGL